MKSQENKEKVIEYAEDSRGQDRYRHAREQEGGRKFGGEGLGMGIKKFEGMWAWKVRGMFEGKGFESARKVRGMWAWKVRGKFEGVNKRKAGQGGEIGIAENAESVV